MEKMGRVLLTGSCELDGTPTEDEPTTEEASVEDGIVEDSVTSVLVDEMEGLLIGDGVLELAGASGLVVLNEEITTGGTRLLEGPTELVGTAEVGTPGLAELDGVLTPSNEDEMLDGES